MIFLFYFLAVLTARTESTLGKYNGMRGGKAVIFNVEKSLLATVFALSLAAFSGGVELHAATLGYSAIYGAFLAVSMVAGLRALSLGSMAITSTVVSFSLVIPTLFGIIFLDESIGIIGIIAFVMLAVSLLLLNYKKSNNPVSARCWFYSILTMVANGISSVIQKLHQTDFPEKYSSEFMLYGMSTAFILLSLVAIYDRIKEGGGREHTKKRLTLFSLLGAGAGVCNGASNYLILTLAATEKASVMFPILSAANAVGSCLVGYIVFKERLTKLQLISLALGVVSVVLLKI